MLVEKICENCEKKCKVDFVLQALEDDGFMKVVFSDKRTKEEQRMSVKQARKKLRAPTGCPFFLEHQLETHDAKQRDMPTVREQS